ncbi:12008_t:CDS:2 [Diversispora eburnea]|uniref:12008_t:CDS:1 n=1 Tax=Diversispora eburnea TaxID=1213867 RepID=A0A9N8VCJ2_9GLOM|nr:12008_t:CDS:2 [Diversispora eburnea]
MKINVEINHKATGTIKFMKIGVKPRDVIGDIRNKIPDINTHSRLYYLGQELENNRNLSDYNIQDDSTITCDGISISNVGSGSDYDAQGDSTKTISNTLEKYEIQNKSTLRLELKVRRGG